MNQPNEQRPDWVMCGIPWDGKVAIVASTELEQAELEARRDRLAAIDPFELLGPMAMAPTRYTLTVQMWRFVLVVADTYEQAFRSLFEQWSPKQPDRRQLAASRPEIGS